MKVFHKLLILAGLALTGAACSPDGETYTPGPESAGAYFATTLPASYDITAEDTSVSIVVSRTEATEALTAAISGSGDPIFTFPASVTFPAGATETTVDVGVDVNNIEIDRSYSVSIELTDNATSYGKSTYAFSVILPAVYESIGKGYWVDNTVNDWYGMEYNDLAMYVEIERAILPGVTKYRFTSPFAGEASEMDELGAFDFYPLNEEADLVPGDDTFVISVTDEGVYLDPVELGMDWGDGIFTIGTVYGTLSNDIAKYPLGVYDEAAGMITFGPNSLFIDEADYGTGICEGTSYLFLSAEAYKAWLAE